ncbi:Endonuclease/exonuclease/phosphatase [Irpex lacteus]|nr:Endonuclease/exonuclease/phosphatase [Irpex lacteus]
MIDNNQDEPAYYNAPQNDEHEPRNKKRSSHKTAATLQIASLNLNGRGSAQPGVSDNKWYRINQLMRARKIAILAVQETHLDDHYVESLHDLFGRRLKIHNSKPPDNPSGSRGVAFVINKDRIDTDTVKEEEIIPGRAILIDVIWHKIVKLRILNVYAPNDHSENESFWRKLKEHWSNTNKRKPDVMLGDFNIVENSLDRKPQRLDPLSPVEALQELYTYFNLSDTWRDTYPERKTFSYAQENGGSMSRIDRIYLNRNLAKNALEWIITPPEGIKTDHLMTTTTLQDKKLPYVGPGRWTIPKPILTDRKFIDFVTQKGKEVTEIIHSMKENNERTANQNTQTIWQHQFKDAIIEEARRMAKVNIPKLQRRIDQMKESRENILNTQTESNEEEENAHWEAALILEEIKSLEAKRFNRSRAAVAINDWTQGEKISKYWTSINKPKTPRDIILTLRDPNSGPRKTIVITTTKTNRSISQGQTKWPTLRQTFTITYRKTTRTQLAPN